MSQDNRWKCPKCDKMNMPTNLACSECATANPQVQQTGGVVLVPRIGNVQAYVTLEGDGIQRQPYAKFGRIKVGEDPRPLNLFNMEEVAALHALTEQVLREAYRMQTIVVPALMEEKG